jgi:hypothetical protein
MKATPNEFHPDYESMYRVYLGGHDLSNIEIDNDFSDSYIDESIVNRDYTLIKVKKLHVHSEYNEKLIINDIAIVKLERKVELSKKIQLACLPPYKTKNKGNRYPRKENTTVYVLGWGQTDPVIRILSTQLKNAKLVIYDFRMCKKTFQGRQINILKQLCIGDLGSFK